jgi:hypothetical protein
MKRLVCGVLLLLLVAGCGGGSDQGGEQQGPDASAQVACADFRSAMRDVQQGILTDEELRDKVKEIDREASVSTQAGLASAGRAMLREVTTGTGEGFVLAAKLFDQSCDEAGL